MQSAAFSLKIRRAKDFFFFILLVLENLPEQRSSQVIEKLYVLLNLATWLRRFTFQYTTDNHTLSGKLCHKFSHAKSCSLHLRKIIRPIRIAKDVIARVRNMIRPIKSHRAPSFWELLRRHSTRRKVNMEWKKFSISPSLRKL